MPNIITNFLTLKFLLQFILTHFMDKAEILNIYSKNYTLPKSNIISRFESHETLESEFHENKVVDKKEKLLVDLTSKKTSLQSQKNMLIKLSNKMGMSPKNKYLNLSFEC